jgi:hypothetical protein
LQEKNLEQRLSELADRLERVEELLLKEATSVEDLQNELRLVRGIVSTVGKLVSLASDLKVVAEERKYGDMERHILESLNSASKPMNISQITRTIKAERGTASRRIVAKKLMAMESSEMVRMVDGKRGAKLYMVSNKSKQ